ncbi:hypothetical protein EDD41_0217 [Luteococcus japonicus]|uniref:Uncharacterized protein n=1 Tax=Luteococcus japonicus TaxID=33984 RepID=A0A3N1ZQB7_9ACTN|nr:hypothetical protein [Luteococcus japonicus]ROR53094.1 hypothetical protein EDD41_0217 [Luteococcus japonicus]
MRMVGGAAAVVTGRDRQGTVVGRADATGFARDRDLAEGRRSARTVPLSAPGKAWTDPMCLVPDQLALFNKAGASVALRSLGADGSADQTVDFPVQMVDPAPVRVFAPAEGLLPRLARFRSSRTCRQWSRMEHPRCGS